MRNDDLEGDIWSVTTGAKWFKKHFVHGPEISCHYFGARDNVERHWDDLTPVERKAVRRFDQTILREMEWILEEDPFLDTPDPAPDDVGRSHWWWFLADIRDGRMEPPAHLKGAA
jgi:hypothetical protein